MEYVSLELMDILIQNGYNHSSENTSNTANWYQVVNWIFRFDDPADEYERQFINNNLEFWYNTLIPELTRNCNQGMCSVNYFDGQKEEEIIKCDDCKLSNYNEFVLEGFISMLLNWFEKNDIKFHLDWQYEGWGYMCYTNNFTHQSSTIGTKQQARHEGILKCFKLVRGE